MLLTSCQHPHGTHRFKVLHWRIAKASHAVPDAQDYDASWRMVQEKQRDQVNEAGTLERFPVYNRQQRVAGSLSTLSA